MRKATVPDSSHRRRGIRAEANRGRANGKPTPFLPSVRANERLGVVVVVDELASCTPPPADVVGEAGLVQHAGPAGGAAGRLARLALGQPLERRPAPPAPPAEAAPAPAGRAPRSPRPTALCRAHGWRDRGGRARAPAETRRPRAGESTTTHAAARRAGEAPCRRTSAPAHRGCPDRAARS